MTISYQDVANNSAMHEKVTPQEHHLIHSLTLPAAIICDPLDLVAFNSAFQELLPEIKSTLDFSHFIDDLQPENTVFETTKVALRNASYPLSVYSRASTSRYVLNAGYFSDRSCGNMLLIIEDATALLSSQKQRQTIHEKLLHTSRTISVGEMSTVLAHELKQPLATISNYLSISQKLIATTDKQKEALQAISFAQSQTRQASEIISRIREFVKTREPKFKEHAALSLLKPALSLLQLEINDQQVNLHIDAQPNLPEVLVDNVMIEQVFTNLIRNAIESMRQTPVNQRKLSIIVKLAGANYVTFKVSDAGCGISNAQKANLFTPFFTTKDEGMGVGLSICRSIVELHGGRLYLQNQNENDLENGSTFICMLPIAEPK